MKKTIKDRLNIPFEKEILQIVDTLNTHSVFDLVHRRSIKDGKLYICWLKPQPWWYESSESIDSWSEWEAFKSVLLLIKLKKDVICIIKLETDFRISFIPFLNTKTVSIKLYSHNEEETAMLSYRAFFADFLLKKIKEAIRVSKKELTNKLKQNIKTIKNTFEYGKE